MKHPKTTLAGALVILAAIANAGAQLAQGHPINMEVLTGAIISGMGLIAAADSQKGQ